MSNENNKVFEKIAMLTSVAVIGGWLIFWSFQINDVIELLRLAYG